MAVTLSTYALTDLDRVKGYRLAQGEELNTTTEQQDLIKNLINIYSTIIENYCDRKFKSREYTEYYDGDGSDTLFMNQYPVSTITSINDDQDWLWSDTTVINSNYYRIVDSRYIVMKNNLFTVAKQSVKAVYTAGFTTTPEDINNACATEVIRAFDGITNLGVESISFLEVSETFVPMPFLPQTRLVLNNYKRKMSF